MNDVVLLGNITVQLNANVSVLEGDGHVVDVINDIQNDHADLRLHVNCWEVVLQDDGLAVPSTRFPTRIVYVIVLVREWTLAE